MALDRHTARGVYVRRIGRIQMPSKMKQIITLMPSSLVKRISRQVSKDPDTDRSKLIRKLLREGLTRREKRQGIVRAS